MNDKNSGKEREHELWRYQVPEQVEGRADKILIQALQSQPPDFAPAPSRSQLHAWIEAGRVTLGGRVIKASHKLKGGEEVQILVPSPVSCEIEAEDLPLEILFEDEHLLVVNKPQGMSVHPSDAERSGTLVNVLLHKVKDLSGIGGVLRPGIVHRIDKMTSGSLLIAKHDESHQKLSQMFSEHRLKRVYWALCYGNPFSESHQPELEVEGKIGRNPKDRKKMMLNAPQGRPSRSLFRLLQAYSRSHQYAFASWIEAELFTGRTHQVRVHLTQLNSSILADRIYGMPSRHQHKWKQLPVEVQKLLQDQSLWPGQALHARLLEFQHPITQQLIRCEAQPQKNFETLLAALREYR